MSVKLLKPIVNSISTNIFNNKFVNNNYYYDEIFNELFGTICAELGIEISY